MLGERKKIPKNRKEEVVVVDPYSRKSNIYPNRKLASAASFDRAGLVPPDWDCPQ